MTMPMKFLELSGLAPHLTYRNYLRGIESPTTWHAAAAHRRKLLEYLDRTPLPSLRQPRTPVPRATAWRPNAAQLAYHAPLALVEGAWLQGLTCTGSGERPTSAALLRAYLGLLGPNAGNSPAQRYRGLLARHGLVLPEAGSHRFGVSDQTGGGAAFAWAALQLALAFGYPDCLPELLGYSIGYLQSGSPWRLAGLEDDRRFQTLQRFAADIGEALESFRHELPGREERIRRGIALYQAGECEYLSALEEAGNGDTPAQRLATLFAGKARTAAPYHHQASLAGKSLRDWFSAEPFDASGFLAALAGSDWVAGERGSRPIDRLTAFGGRMFGVFSEEELTLIDQWLETGASKPVAAFTVSNALKQPGPETDPEVQLPQSIAPTLPLHSETTGFAENRRRLFHQLLNPLAFPSALPAARRLVERQLAATRRRWPWHGEPPIRYSPERFDHWIESRHRKQLHDGSSHPSKPKLSRDEYRWGIIQMTPAVLVDGCWLDLACLAADQGDPVRRRLLAIGSDDAGGGNPAHNHPAIYRKLLKELGVVVAPTTTSEFARSPLFLDAAFDLPAYLLAIGRHPLSHFPEILGLNLAIELSGLGTQYRLLAEDLEFWGIDSTIVRLHQSIDNLASGHAALAAEAIRIHLDNTRTTLGEDVTASQWCRIRSGYLSLENVLRRFKRALLLRYLWRFLLPRVLAGCVKSLRQVLPSAARLQS
ncbi:MAG: iron-containing redox enzyme family protein [Methylococcaceae bacterium]|nr:iron-containing redox enzyme family protein [Methylococcaceae bacterium]